MRFRKLGILTLVLMIFAMIAMPTVAHAEPIYIESLDITVNTKDNPTKTVVIDKRGVLTEEEFRQIENAGERLRVYNLGLYIEMTDPDTCSQKYATTLAEEKYPEMLPEENSIMIAFSFYKDENGYYGVHYNVQGDLSERKISGIIEGTYHDFKTDGSWIAGSTDQVVDYLTEVENNLLTTDEREAVKQQKMQEFLKVLRVALETIAVIIIFSLILFYKRRMYEIERIMEGKNSEIKRIKSEYSDLMHDKGIVESDRDELKIWKSRAIEADSDIEGKIKTLLAIKKAQKFSRDYASASTLGDYIAMMDRFSSMSGEEKSYVTLDMDRARDMLDELAKIEAKKATERIEETCQLSSTRENYSTYSNTVNYCDGLPSCVRMLIAVNLLNNLKDNHSKAQSDYRHHQESSSYHSSSYSSHSSHSSSSFGGFHSGSFGGGFGGGH